MPVGTVGWLLVSALLGGWSAKRISGPLGFVAALLMPILVGCGLAVAWLIWDGWPTAWLLVLMLLGGFSAFGGFVGWLLVTVWRAVRRAPL